MHGSVTDPAHGTTRDRGVLRRGEHVCAVLDGERDRAELAARFVADGLAATERVWYLAERPETIIDWLRAAAIDVDAASDRGQLAVLPAADSYLATRPFDPDATVAMMHEAVDEALAAGYAGFRVTGEMAWATRDAAAARRLTEYEMLVGEVFASRPAAAICQYDARLFDHSALAAALAAHPQCSLAEPDSSASYASIEPLPDGTGLRISGEVDLANRCLLRQALASLPADGRVHLDLADLTFIDVAGTTELVRFASAARHVVLHAPPPQLRRIVGLLWPAIQWEIRP